MSQRPSKQSKGTDAPLTGQEMEMLVQQMQRMVINGQEEHYCAILDRVNPKGSNEIRRMLNQAQSSMTDAPKRRHDEESVSCSDKWEQLEMLESELISSPPRGQGYASKSPGEDSRVPFPTDINDVHQWSTVICTMKKYAKDEYKYSDLVKKAESDADCARYLSWIVSTYGSDLTKKVVKSVPETPSGDLACYLQRIQWEPPRTGRPPFRIFG